MNNHSQAQADSASTAPAADQKPRTMWQQQAGQAGFTIVEVLVAAVVFAVGLTAIAAMQTHSVEQATFSDQITMRVNAVQHWSEAFMRMPIMEDTVELDEGNILNVAVSDIFDDDSICEHGVDDCDWTYLDFEERKPLRVRYRVTRNYPLPNLVMIEKEVVPTGVSEAVARRRTMRNIHVRSTRWN